MNYKILVLTMAISNCLFLPISENPRGSSIQFLFAKLGT